MTFNETSSRGMMRDGARGGGKVGLERGSNSANAASDLEDFSWFMSVVVRVDMMISNMFHYCDRQIRGASGAVEAFPTWATYGIRRGSQLESPSLSKRRLGQR